MTTALAIKCNDGIILASDSQSSDIIVKTKSLTEHKILKISDFVGLIGSGDADHIKIVADYLTNNINNKNLTNQELFHSLTQVSLDLRKEYNTNRAISLGLDKQNYDYFRPTCLVGAKCDNTYLIYLIRSDGLIMEITDYKVIGSGTRIANYLLYQQKIASENNSLNNLPLSYNSFVACYVINENKKFDLQTGGDTHISIIDTNGYSEMSKEIIDKHYTTYADQYSSSIALLTNNEETQTRFRKLLNY